MGPSSYFRTARPRGPACLARTFLDFDTVAAHVARPRRVRAGPSSPDPADAHRHRLRSGIPRLGEPAADDPHRRERGGQQRVGVGRSHRYGRAGPLPSEGHQRCASDQLHPPQSDPGPCLGGRDGAWRPVSVTISCQFQRDTPIISNLLGGTILLTSQPHSRSKEGAVAAVPGGGAPIAVPRRTSSTRTPQSGWSPLTVAYTDTSTGSPTSWVWDFSVGASTTGAGVGSVSPATGLAQGPTNVVYTCTGNAGDTCTFGASLQVGNAGGTTATQRPTTSP